MSREFWNIGNFKLEKKNYVVVMYSKTFKISAKIYTPTHTSQSVGPSYILNSYAYHYIRIFNIVGNGLERKINNEYG